MPNLHSVWNIVIMFQTVVVFLEKENCWLLISGRHCFDSCAKFFLMQSYHLISSQRCQCCVNITCNSDVKWIHVKIHLYIRGGDGCQADLYYLMKLCLSCKNISEP